MQIFHKLEEYQHGFGPTIVSVGNFDGVHRAHQTVLRDIAAIAPDNAAQIRRRHVRPASRRVFFDPTPA